PWMYLRAFRSSGSSLWTGAMLLRWTNWSGRPVIAAARFTASPNRGSGRPEVVAYQPPDSDRAAPTMHEPVMPTLVIWASSTSTTAAHGPSLSWPALGSVSESLLRV